MYAPVLLGGVMRCVQPAKVTLWFFLLFFYRYGLVCVGTFVFALLRRGGKYCTRGKKSSFFFYSHPVEERRIYHSWRERKERQRSLVLLLTRLAVCLGTAKNDRASSVPLLFFFSFIMSQVHVPDPTMGAAVHDAKKKRIRKMSASRACVL